MDTEIFTAYAGFCLLFIHSYLFKIKVSFIHPSIKKRYMQSCMFEIKFLFIIYCFMFGLKFLFIHSCLFKRHSNTLELEFYLHTLVYLKKKFFLCSCMFAIKFLYIYYCVFELKVVFIHSCTFAISFYICSLVYLN